MSAKRRALAEAQKREEAEERCRVFLQVMQSEDWPYFDRGALKNVEFVRATPGRVEYRFTVDESQCNSMGNLHGGCAATMLDDLTSTATLTTEHEGDGDYDISVSRSLSCVYLKALPIGEKCSLVAELVRAGRQLLNLRGEIRGADGRPAVVCSHDKVRTNPPKL